MRLTVLDPRLFLAEKTFLRVPEKFKTFKIIPAQLPNNTATEVFINVAKGFEITSETSLVSNFIANIMISGALNYLWGMINCL